MVFMILIHCKSCAKKWSHLQDITDEIMGVAEDTGSKVGTGGMKSKLQAAKTALSLGVKVFIGLGSGKPKYSISLQETGMEPILVTIHLRL